MRLPGICNNFLKYVYWFLEKGREKHWLVASHSRLDWGLNPKTSYVPWLGIEPLTFWCTGQYSNQLNHVSKSRIIGLFMSPQNEVPFFTYSVCLWKAFYHLPLWISLDCYYIVGVKKEEKETQYRWERTCGNIEKQSIWGQELGKMYWGIFFMKEIFEEKGPKRI